MSEQDQRLQANAELVQSTVFDAIRALAAKDRASFDDAGERAIKLGVKPDAFKKLILDYQNESVDYGFMRSVAQGVTFGFADEIEALAKSAVGDGTYEQEVAKVRAGKAAYEGEYPMRAMAGEIAGALPSLAFPAGLALKGATTVGKAVLPATRMAPRGAPAAAPTFTGEGIKATAVGTGEGFLGGYGRGETEAERFEKGVQEGIIGGVGGATIQSAIGGGTRLLQSMQPVDVVAQQRVASTIARGDEPRVSSEVTERLATGDEMPETLADIIGGQAQKTVKATRMGGEQDFDVATGKFLTERMTDAPTRVSQAVGDFGEGLGVDVFEELDADVLRLIRDDAAYKAYQPIREANPELSIRDMGFDKFFDDDMISESVYNKVVSDMRRLVAGGKMEADSIDGVPNYQAIKRALNRGRDVNAPFAFFDQVQREIADVARKGKSGETRTSGASYQGIADDMDLLLRTKVDGYADAKSAYKANSDVLTASELGKKAASKSRTAAQVEKDLSGLGEDARKAYIQSALNSLVRTFDVEGRDYATRILQSKESKAKLKALVGEQSDEVYTNLLTRLGRESRMARSGQAMTPRSDTAQNLAMMQGQGLDILQSPMQQVQQRLLEGIVSNLPSRRSAVTQRAGEMLMETAPYQQRRILSGVESQLPTQRKIENIAVGGGRAARLPSLLSPAMEDKPVTIYTDEQMRQMGMGGLLR